MYSSRIPLRPARTKFQSARDILRSYDVIGIYARGLSTGNLSIQSLPTWLQPPEKHSERDDIGLRIVYYELLVMRFRELGAASLQWRFQLKSNSFRVGWQKWFYSQARHNPCKMTSRRLRFLAVRATHLEQAPGPMC